MRRSLKLLLIVSSCFGFGVAGICAYVLISYPEQAAAGSLTTMAAVGKINLTVTTAANAPDSQVAAAKSAKPSTKVKASIPTTAACSKGVYAAPIAVQISADQPGLHSTITPPTSYKVYGNSTSQILNQIKACSPVSDGDSFSASTDYAINWAFRYAPIANGLCTISSASVGINLSMVFPTWQPGSDSPASLSSSWQSFIANLNTHEVGHARLDQAAAANLLTDLQTFPPTDCSTINTAANATANADITSLDQANNAYDAATSHGVTQGAVLR